MTEVALHAVEQGPAGPDPRPPVLLVHGLGGHIFTWRHLLPRLARRHRTVALDLKGFGASPRPADGAYAPADHAALVARFIEDRDLQDLVLVGHSLGGAVALLTALGEAETRRPRLQALVLIGSPAYPQPLPFYLRLFRLPLVGEAAVTLLPPALVVRGVLRASYADPARITRDQVAGYAAPLADPLARRALLRTARQLVPPDVEAIAARYPRLALPVLLVWGEMDHIVPVAIGRRLGRDLPRAELTVIPDCGHIPQEEQPEATWSALGPFLERLG